MSIARGYELVHDYIDRLTINFKSHTNISTCYIQYHSPCKYECHFETYLLRENYNSEVLRGFRATARQ